MSDPAEPGAETSITPPRRARPRLATALPVAPALLALTLLSRAAGNAGQTTYPLIARDQLGLTGGEVGGLAAAAGLAGVACATLVAGRARRVRPARLLAWGQIGALASLAMLAVPAGRPGLWLGALGLGAASGLVFPALMTVIAARAPGRRSQALAVMAVVLSISLVLGPLAESGLLSATGQSPRAALGLMVVLPAGAAVLALRVAAGGRRPVASRGADADLDGSDGPDLRAAAAGSPAGEPEAFLRPAGGDATLAVPDQEVAGGAIPGGAGGAVSGGAGGAVPARAFRLALTVMLAYQVPFAAVVSFGAILARSVDGVSAAGTQQAFAVFFAASALVRVLLVWRPPGRHRPLVLAASAAATVVGVAGLGLSGSPAGLLGSMAVLGLPHGTTFPLASSILAEQQGVGEMALGRANGRLMAGTNAASVVTPFALGWLAATAGYRTAFLLIEIPVGLAALLLFVQLRPHLARLRRPPAPQSQADGQATRRRAASSRRRATTGSGRSNR
jgi:DHA1 family multidrug resistance protein-like MFS transporter